ncbi:MAG: hypothetical protein JWP00_1498 [Chloroflexi bacterium]|nr:hypothetical protein [Chloroflexota bacterium]
MKKFNLLKMPVTFTDESLDQFYTSFNNEEVKKVAEVFIKNVKATYSMLSLPVIYVNLATVSLQFEMYQLTTILADGFSLEQAYNLMKLPPGSREKISFRVMEQLEKDRRSPEDGEARKNQLAKIIREVTNNEAISSGIQALAYSAITFSWTSFESMAGDLWVSLVNNNPHEFGDKAFNLPVSEQAKQRGEIAAKQPEGLANKLIEYRFLAEHDFDLKNKMGTILRDKFDFTGVYGVITAYSTIFPEKRADFSRILDKKELKLLMKTRNLIVHKAGIVDNVYQKETREFDPPSMELGKPLFLDEQETANFVDTGIKAGIELISFIDNLMA